MIVKNKNAIKYTSITLLHESPLIHKFYNAIIIPHINNP